MRAPEHFDVVIIGCGISGIGAGAHLRRLCPDRSFVILERRSELGGTWSLFKYPGVRTDSDMFTMGFDFKPWRHEDSMASGEAILNYLRETVQEYDLERHIRYSQGVETLDWSTSEHRWRVTTTQGESSITGGFVMYGGGYYSYSSPHQPTFNGQEDFHGRVVHPQFWSDDIDHAGKRVVIIGSGATAITMLPAMAKTAARVTMLQRSPTYIAAVPNQDWLQTSARGLIPDSLRYTLVRLKKIALQQIMYSVMTRYPQFAQNLLRKGVNDAMGDTAFDVADFKPSYNPWEQRLCAAPDGDFFRALKTGRASVTTDHIDRFTSTGIKLKSGRELEADLIVTATGLNATFVFDGAIRIDGAQVDTSACMMYKGTFMSGVPNLAVLTGYTNASWTLKVDLICRFVCRLLKHMSSHGYSQCCAPRDDSISPESLIGNLTSNYILRAVEKMPKQGDREPWKLHQNYFRDMMLFSWGAIEDKTMQFSRPMPRAKL